MLIKPCALMVKKLEMQLDHSMARISKFQKQEQSSSNKKKNKKKKKKGGKAGEADTGDAPADAEKEEESKSNAPEFTVEKLNKGSGGRFIKNGDIVQCRYTGKLLDGTMFDQNQTKEGFEFTVGNGSVIKAWDEGFVQLRKGMKAKITAPPDFAYGKEGHAGGIPPNATLIFDVEVIKII